MMVFSDLVETIEAFHPLKTSEQNLSPRHEPNVYFHGNLYLKKDKITAD